ncbi:MAG: phosphotransferase, partial [Deltaproteobacteria bacterium]|nr:phosphotransferase [Deltaproteobacteria bacterium]MBW2537164.1 phosphotransferase [Deltaproteobacteria bacterium]
MPSKLTNQRLGGAGTPSSRFALRRRVSRGELVEVWLARDRTRGCDVALKVGWDARAAESIAAEALHASLALSPRLPELVGLGWLVIEGGEARQSEPPSSVPARPTSPEPDAAPLLPRPFVAVRWIAGTPLDQLCGTLEQAPDQVLGVARDAAEALADLHDVGLAHGDVKPQNLIRGDDGRVALIDLGLSGPAYRTAVPGGTPRYLARGDAALGDGRARDLVALGAVLAELSSTDVCRGDDPIRAARTATLPSAVATVSQPLLTPAPGARPSARWVRST